MGILYSSPGNKLSVPKLTMDDDDHDDDDDDGDADDDRRKQACQIFLKFSLSKLFCEVFVSSVTNFCCGVSQKQSGHPRTLGVLNLWQYVRPGCCCC